MEDCIERVSEERPYRAFRKDRKAHLPTLWRHSRLLNGLTAVKISHIRARDLMNKHLKGLKKQRSSTSLRTRSATTTRQHRDKTVHREQVLHRMRAGLFFENPAKSKHHTVEMESVEARSGVVDQLPFCLPQEPDILASFPTCSEGTQELHYETNSPTQPKNPPTRGSQQL